MKTKTRPALSAAPAVLAVAVAAAMGLAACGSEEGSREPASPATGKNAAAPSYGHVHALGVDGSDGSLLVATHAGLFRATKSSTKLKRVGSSTADYMGFAVAGPKRYLASGHPPQGSGGPPLLGLIESSDRGRSWRSVSLSGRADFHALRVSGKRVYGFDSTSGQVLASRDRGRKWSSNRPPAMVHDLAIAPGSPSEVLASTEAGLALSRDEADTWRVLDPQRAGLLAWPSPRELFLVAGDGSVGVSRDRGRSFRTVGNIGGQPAALLAVGQELYAALGDGTIKRSADAGRSWNVRVGG